MKLEERERRKENKEMKKKRFRMKKKELICVVRCFSVAVVER